MDIIGCIPQEEAINVKHIILTCILILAVVGDMRSHKVRNELIAAGYIAGLIYHFSEQGQGIIFFAQGAFLPIILLYLLFRMGALGAGDIKLLSVVGGFVGYSRILQIILLAFLIGAFISLIRMLSHRQLLWRILHFKSYVADCLISKSFLTYSTLNQPESYLHFTICIMAGTVLTTIKEVLF